VNEKELKSKLVKKIRTGLRGVVVFRHEDQWTAGIPDISVTLRGTCWIEVKYIREGKKLEMRGIQLLTCQNLADNGKCFVLIYEDTYFGPKTHIISPYDVEEFREMVTTHPFSDGYDHDAVVNYLRSEIFSVLSPDI